MNFNAVNDPSQLLKLHEELGERMLNFNVTDQAQYLESLQVELLCVKQNQSRLQEEIRIRSQREQELQQRIKDINNDITKKEAEAEKLKHKAEKQMLDLTHTLSLADNECKNKMNQQRAEFERKLANRVEERVIKLSEERADFKFAASAAQQHVNTLTDTLEKKIKECDELRQQLDASLTSRNVSKNMGERFEEECERFLLEHLGLLCDNNISRTHGIHCADIRIVTNDGYKIIIDAKSGKDTDILPQKEIGKLLNDVKKSGSDGGLIISQKKLPRNVLFMKITDTVYAVGSGQLQLALQYFHVIYAQLSIDKFKKSDTQNTMVNAELVNEILENVGHIFELTTVNEKEEIKRANQFKRNREGKLKTLYGNVKTLATLEPTAVPTDFANSIPAKITSDINPDTTESTKPKRTCAKKSKLSALLKVAESCI